MQSLRHADFVIEAVVEDEGIKRAIFQQLDKVGMAHTCTWMGLSGRCYSVTDILITLNAQLPGTFAELYEARTTNQQTLALLGQALPVRAIRLAARNASNALEFMMGHSAIHALS